jgi:hypothetical protein
MMAKSTEAKVEYAAKPQDLETIEQVSQHRRTSTIKTHCSQALYEPDSYIADTQAYKTLIKKQDRHILPLSALCYFILNIDRSNVGNAKTMNADTQNDLLSETNMTEFGYIISLMLFFIIYA